MPDRFDRGRLGEEAVSADVESPSVALDRLADPADGVGRLEDDDVTPVIREMERRGQSGGTCSDDDDGWSLWFVMVAGVVLPCL
jgi:hypothetical protein